MAELFAPDAVIRRVSAEPALLVGAGRALLLQVAHPAVAAGVADHSDFQRHPFRRLQGTLEAVYSIVFGSEELADGIGRRIRRIHDHVVGPAYAANDPENLLWVHATLVDTALACYSELVAPLTSDEQEAYYRDMTRVAEVFGCPRDAQPSNLDAFRDYVDDQVASMEVTSTGQRLAQEILHPDLPRALAPALAVHRLVAVGMTPAKLRAELSLAWDADRQRRFERAKTAVRGLCRATPARVRVAPMHPITRWLRSQAAEHVAAFELTKGQESG